MLPAKMESFLRSAAYILALSVLSLGFGARVEARAVSSSAELKVALRTAKGGETIRLAPGRYEDLVVKRGESQRYSAMVTVQAADSRSPPRFIKPVVLHEANNLTLKGLHFALGGSVVHQPLLRLYGGQNVMLIGNLFEGIRTEAGHFNYGIVAADIVGLRIAENRFARLNRGIGATRINGFKAYSNDMRDMGHDGFSLAAIDGGEIVGNLIEDFYPLEKYHPDGIQFHANAQVASRNLLIQHNLIIGHPDRRIQGIFMRAGYASDPTQRYRNVRILDNIIAAAMWHAIAVSQADGLEIARNQVLHVPGSDRMEARISTREAVGFTHANVAPRVLLNEGMKGTRNTRRGVATIGEVGRVRSAWLARFRPGRADLRSSAWPQ
jgi:hypothetical protein